MQVLDDQGLEHKFYFPRSSYITGSSYIPEGKVRLLSPQHWAQTQKDPRIDYCLDTPLSVMIQLIQLWIFSSIMDCFVMTLNVLLCLLLLASFIISAGPD